VVSQSLTLAGREFQTEGAATERARPAMSVRVRGTTSSGTAAEIGAVSLVLPCAYCLGCACVCVTAIGGRPAGL